MNVALIAHDKKKELMVEFCIAYSGILSKHTIVATGTTGSLVSEATGLKIQKFLTGPQGGDQQIGARIAYNELDMVLFFADPSGNESLADVQEISKLCDQHNIPFASNIATAEMLILGLSRGDLDWRLIVNPRSRPIA